MMKFNWSTAASATSVLKCGGEADLREVRETLKEWEAPFLVLDSEVNSLWSEDLQPLIASSSGIYVMEAREVLKNTFTLSQIWDSMAAAGITRDTPVVVIGGGVVCDTGALAASTYLRGLRLILVPTTLLCMVDACLGGKTGVNLSGAKNQVGTFNPAEVVILCTAFLRTLPDREFRSGMAEVIKTALIGDRELGSMLQGHEEPGGEELLNVVTRCLAVKGRIVEEDLEDRGSRMILNMGHTVGHALESCSGFHLSHGEAVGLGMLAEAAMAVNMGGDRNLPQEIRSLLRNAGLPTETGPDIPLDELESLLTRDKKSLRSGRIWALPFGWCDCRLVCISSEEEKGILPGILRLLKV